MNLYNQVYPGESFSEQQFYEAVRYILGPESYQFTQDQLEDALLDRIDEMSESEASAFWKNLGGNVLKVASVAAPIVGTVVGGPAGTLIGGLAGKMATQGAGALNSQQVRRQQLIKQQRLPVQSGGDFSPNGQERPPTRDFDGNQPPVSGGSQPDNSIQPLLSQLANLLNNPHLLSMLSQQKLRTVPPDAPVEKFSFVEMIESLNSISNDLLTEYYDRGYLPSSDYAYSRNGNLIPVNRSRIDQLNEEICNFN